MQRLVQNIGVMAIATAACTFLATDSWAQSGSRNVGGGGAAAAGGGGGGGAAGGGGGGVSSIGSDGSVDVGSGSSGSSASFAESQANAAATIIRSQGQYGLDVTEAAINLEEARKKAIENKIAAYEAQNAVLRSIIERNGLKRELVNSRRPRGGYSGIEPVSFDHGNGPVRLASHQLDQSAGKIEWPSILQARQFASERQELNRLFDARAEVEPGRQHLIDEEIRTAARRFQTKLRRERRNLSVATYIRGKKFLDGLWVETFHADSPVNLHDHHHGDMKMAMR